jgi:hypothetical protein
VEDANKEETYSITCWVSTFDEEKSRVFDPRTRELQKEFVQGPGRGRMEVEGSRLELSWIGWVFQEGPMDKLLCVREFLIGKLKSQSDSEEN